MVSFDVLGGEREVGGKCAHGLFIQVKMQQSRVQTKLGILLAAPQLGAKLVQLGLLRAGPQGRTESSCVGGHARHLAIELRGAAVAQAVAHRRAAGQARLHDHALFAWRESQLITLLPHLWPWQIQILQVVSDVIGARKGSKVVLFCDDGRRRGYGGAHFVGERGRCVFIQSLIA